MKKIEELAIEKYMNQQSMPKHKQIRDSNYIDWAYFGANEVQRWIPIIEEFPLTYKSGHWDGLKSDFVIAKDSTGEWHKAHLYSGFMDGSSFNSWYDERDFELNDITHWRPLERL